jgi:hypothetical protein
MYWTNTCNYLTLRRQPVGHTLVNLGSLETPRRVWHILAFIPDRNKISRVRTMFSRSRKLLVAKRKWCDITSAEVLAFFGLLYICGLLGFSKMNSHYLWSSSTIVPCIFKAVMPRDRFKLILACIRFDDMSTRAERRSTYKFAPLRDVWEEVVNNCRYNYNPTEYLTIDEQLLSFRGRSPFKQYMPSKPCKYGNKFWLMADSKTYYVCNGIPYVGKQAGADRAVGLGSDVVLKLSAYVYNTGRNITMDNFFSSVPLAESLLSKRLTMLGTMRKNKHDIPQQFLPSKQRPPGTQSMASRKTLPWSRTRLKRERRSFCYLRCITA